MPEKLRWTDEMKYRMVTLAHKHKGYIKTDVNMNIKWNKILTCCREEPIFSELSADYSAMSLQNKFRTTSAELLKELGITVEGANLSGLPESASPYQKLIVAMAEEVHIKAFRSQKESEKKRKVQAGMLTYEIQALSAGGRRPVTGNEDSDSGAEPLPFMQTSTPPQMMETGESVAPVNESAKPSGSGSSSSTDTKDKPGKGFLDRFNQAVIDMTKDDPDDVALEREVKRKKVDLEERAQLLREQQFAFQQRQWEAAQKEAEEQRQAREAHAKELEGLRALLASFTKDKN